MKIPGQLPQIQQPQKTQSTQPSSSLEAALRAPSTTTTLPFEANTFEVPQAKQKVEVSPAAQQKMEKAIGDFSGTIERILHHDIDSLARGQRPVLDASQLTDTQREQLQSATKDFLQQIPVGALSPTATKELKGLLQEQGLSTKNIETKTLKELGKVGQKLAKKWAKDLKHDSPLAYYGLAAAAGAAIGTYGYLQGSEGLKKLGIKPKFKTKLFDDKVQLQAEAMWDKHFKNFGVQGDVSGRHDYKNFQLQLHAHFNTRDSEKNNASLSLRRGSDEAYVQASSQLQAGKVSEYSLRAHKDFGNTEHLGHVTLDTQATYDSSFDFSSGNVNVASTYNHGSTSLDLGFGQNYEPSTLKINSSYQEGNFSINASAERNLQNHATTAQVSTTYRDNNVGVSTTVERDFHDHQTSVAVSGDYHTDNLTFSGSLSHNFDNDVTTAQVSATYTHDQNLEFGLNASYDEQNHAKVTAGFKWRF